MRYFGWQWKSPFSSLPHSLGIIKHKTSAAWPAYGCRYFAPDLAEVPFHHAAKAKRCEITGIDIARRINVGVLRASSAAKQFSAFDPNETAHQLVADAIVLEIEQDDIEKAEIGKE